MYQYSGTPLPGAIAGGTINPHRICYISPSADNTYLQGTSATAQSLIGISQEGTLYSAIGLDTGAAATVGLQISIFGPGCVAGIELSGTSTSGDLITSDGSGKGLTTTTTGNRIVGYLTESGAAGDIKQIIVQPFVL